MVTLPLKGVHMEIKRMQIWYADMSPVVGSEQGGFRPVLIVQNDIGNKHSPTVIGAPITSVIGKKRLPTQVTLTSSCGLSVESMVMCEQLRTMDKRRLKSCLGEVTEIEQIKSIEKALQVSLGI